MNKMMINFLNELADLFDKYNITYMRSESNRYAPVGFYSNGKTLRIGHYGAEQFRDITVNEADYSPKRCKNCLFECSGADVEPCCGCDEYEYYTEKPTNE